MQTTRKTTYAKQAAIYGLLGIWAVLSMEVLSRSDLPKSAQWGLHHAGMLAINSLLVCLLLLVLRALTNSLRAAYGIVLSGGLVLAYISGIKLKFLGLPVLPSDLALLDDAKGVVPLQDALQFPLLLGGLACLALGLVLVWALARHQARLPLRQRAAVAAVSLALLTLAFLPPGAAVASMLRVENINWDQAHNVRVNGLLVSLLLNTYVRESAKPALKLDLSQNYAHPAGGSPTAPGVKPNIIVVLSESLWDPTKLPGVTFSEDPMPFYRTLAKQYTSGEHLSPVFGAGTANVEMELLTGLSAQLIPQGTYPLLDHVKFGVDSLASILGRQGYSTTAVSPWPWEVYGTDSFKYMGFSHVFPREYLKADISGYYIADREVARTIISVAGQSQPPYLIYANTAENHYEYLPGKFGAPEIDVNANNLSLAQRGILQSYAQGCFDADKMLRTLVEHFRQVEQPTIIVFFGDHLPILGPEKSIYKATGYLNGDDDPDALNKLHRAPMLIWNNYLPGQKDTINWSPTFLTPYLLKLAGQPGTAFTDYLAQLSQRFPAIPARDNWPALGIAESDLANYEAMEQDILFGDRKTYGEMKESILDPNFTLGLGPPTLASATVKRGLVGSTLTVAGHHLPPKSVLYLDAKKLATTWVDEQTLTSTLPLGFAAREGADVQVRITSDDGKRTIAQSGLVQVTSQ